MIHRIHWHYHDNVCLNNTTHKTTLNWPQRMNDGKGLPISEMKMFLPVHEIQEKATQTLVFQAHWKSQLWNETHSQSSHINNHCLTCLVLRADIYIWGVFFKARQEYSLEIYKIRFTLQLHITRHSEVVEVHFQKKSQFKILLRVSENSGLFISALSKYLRHTSGCEHFFQGPFVSPHSYRNNMHRFPKAIRKEQCADPNPWKWMGTIFVDDSSFIYN